MKFWHEKPIIQLGQRWMSLPYGLYPNAPTYSQSGTMGYGDVKLTDCRVTSIPQHERYTYQKRQEMLAWCNANCTGPVTQSEPYGSWAFSSQRDQAMFRLFFGDETMGEPVIAEPQYAWNDPFENIRSVG